MVMNKVMNPLKVVGGTDEQDQYIDMPPEMDAGLGTPDGGLEFNFGEKSSPGIDMSKLPFDVNLAEVIPAKDLMMIGNDLRSMYDADKRSRADWEKTYLKGLDLLGFKVEERSMPWAGAAGVYHPVLAEATVRFEAQAMMELCPATGPADTMIFGKHSDDSEKIKQANRVKSEMNYQTMYKMTEFRSEMESMLFQLPLAGSAFKKVYYDPLMKRPVSMFVPADDFVISYGSSDLQSSPRYTHVMRRHSNDVRKLQSVGFYRDVILPDPVPEYSDVKTKNEQIEGTTSVIEYDDRHVLLEMHVDYDVPGFEEDIALPYVITLDWSSFTVLSIRRNWDQQDSQRNKQVHFVPYQYLPGLGFYGTGLIHLIGGLSKSATSILRQLLDAGTLSVLPSGFKARGFRVKANDSPIRPGEFRDTDVPAGTLKDSIFPLPVKEPSAVMFQLLQNVVDEARRIGSVADIKATDLSSQAPVGTTLALLERSLKVISGVQARLHAALKLELRLLSKIIQKMGGDYEYDEQPYNRTADFSSVDVVPVSDPNAAMMAQRVVQYTAAMDMAQRAKPGDINMPKLMLGMFQTLNIRSAEEIVNIPQNVKALDPVSENMAMLNNGPVKADMAQDHEAHIKAHMAMAQDPKILELVGQSPQAVAVQAAMSAHIAEHLAFNYRNQIQARMPQGVQLPPPGQPMDPAQEAQLSQMVAQAAQQLLMANTQLAAQAQALAEAQDPMIQIEKKKLELTGLDLMRKTAKDAADHDIATRKIQAENSRKGAELGVRIADGQRQEKTAHLQVAGQIAQAGLGHQLGQDQLAHQHAQTVIDHHHKTQDRKLNKEQTESELAIKRIQANKPRPPSGSK